MTNKDSLGDRMKQYEAVPKNYLMRRTPVIIRLDGISFHNYTKSFKTPRRTGTPFNAMLHEVMVHTTHALVHSIQNCVFGYTQSDEISLLLRDYDSIECQPWYNNNVQKLVSASATKATNAFNFKLQQLRGRSLDWSEYAEFDSRAANYPMHEVVNYFIWRQQDAIRNSIQMLGHHYFSPNEMHGLSNPQVISKLDQIGQPWDSIPTWAKQGTCVIRATKTIDEAPPQFVLARHYIQQHVESCEKDE